MKSSPRRRIGRDGMLLAAMLCVPVLVLLGFRVAAAPSDPPPVEERPIQLTSETTSPRPTSTTSPSTSSKTTSKTTSTTKSSTTTRSRTTAPRSTSTPTRTPTWTSRTQAPAPSYGDDDDDDEDDDDDDEWDDD